METASTQAAHAPVQADGSAPVRMTADVASIWERHRDTTSQRLESLEQTAAALVEGTLDDGQRHEAAADAHKLAGSIGVFGFLEGSRLAQEIESLIQGSAPLAASDVLLFTELVVSLRHEVERSIHVAPDTAESGSVPKPQFAIVSADAELVDGFIAQAAGRGARPVAFGSLAEAGGVFAAARPDVVVLDLSPPTDLAAGLRLLKKLSARRAAVPVLVLADDAAQTDRVEVARLGGRAFIKKPASAQHVVEAATQALEQRRAPSWTVLIVDDDPVLAKSVRALLAPHRLNVIPLCDPTRFWETLEAVSPDMVILDVEMPEISGIDLAKAVRNSSRWDALPVMFLSASDQPETVRAAFAAGADDYLRKPVSGVDLAARVIGRLGRSEAIKSAGWTDALTGAADRNKAQDVATQLLRMAGRHGQPVCVTVLDIDDFAGLAQKHGRMAANVVLRRVAAMLLNTFRGEDVVCRWRHDEFLVAMYGMERVDGVHRIASLLERLRQERFVAGRGGSYGATFSAGVAQFPVDGADLDALVQAASAALTRAKTSGRDRIEAVQVPTGDSEAATDIDVAVVEDDEATASLLLHALQTRGYTTRRFRDGPSVVATLTAPDALERIRVVLLDVDLPGLDGLSVLRRLARDGVLRRSRVIMLTVRASEAEIVTSLELGAFDHIAKPFSLPILMQRVRLALKA